MNTSRTLAVLSLPAAMLLLSTPALADPPTSRQSFGGHVSSCAQTTGFSSTHNPGMHRGAAGWDTMPC